MATLFRSKLINGLGTTPQTILTSVGTATTTIVGMSLTNLTESIILASILLSDANEGTTAYFIKDVIVPPNQSLRVVNGGERLVVGPLTSLVVSANTEESLDVVLSYVEIS